MSVQLYPEVQDATTLGARFSQPSYLVVGVEGQMDSGGAGAEATVYTISRPADADTQFGAASSLGLLVKFLLKRGVPSVVAVPSKKGSSPVLADRQAAWELLTSRDDVRIRLTDSTTQADLAALADSCEEADAIQHKQFAIVGLPVGTAISAYGTAAAAIASKRAVLVGPGIYDESGIIRDGSYAAAATAAEVAKNPDIADDLDLALIPGLTGIEQDGTTGVPVFRLRIVGGTPTNDFETLLQAGSSPLQNAPGGGVQFTHLRMTYTSDTTFDALMTRLIVDQLFVDVKNYCLENNFLRRGNTQANRDDLKAGVEGILVERSNWLRPKIQPDGTLGYLVAVVPSTDGRQVTVTYQGIVVRGIQTILLDGSLDIPV
jgi:hypothetical protein